MNATGTVTFADVKYNVTGNQELMLLMEPYTTTAGAVLYYLHGITS